MLLLLLLLGGFLLIFKVFPMGSGGRLHWREFGRFHLFAGKIWFVVFGLLQFGLD